MKILFFGDVMGKAGRKALTKALPFLQNAFQPDLIIANAENMTHGFGATHEHCQELYKAGVHIITMGNHTWDQKEMISYIDKDPFVIRPLNLAAQNPGKGYAFYDFKDGRKACVISLMGNLFMEASNLCFPRIVGFLENVILGKDVSTIIIDFHAESTSEKMALGLLLDGKVSAILGTHTHIPTADARILAKGTAYITDVGMCGDYDSVIGMNKQTPIHRFMGNPGKEKLSPSDGEATICGCFIETDDQNGKAVKIHSIVQGPHLENYPKNL